MASRWVPLMTQPAVTITPDESIEHAAGLTRN